MFTLTDDKVEFLRNFRLSSGSHELDAPEMCAMELVAWAAGEGRTDAPECASIVLRRFVIRLNDGWSDLDRQKLLAPAEGSDVPGSRYLMPMIGTAGDGQDEARGYMALDWLIRTCTPAWLDLAGCAVEAAALRDLRRIVDSASADAARPAIRAGRTAAAAADAYACTADAADAAAAYTAAAAAAAAYTADAAYAYTADAAAYTAAYAYTASLRPTLAMLQDSALDLLERMINPASSNTE